MGKTDLSSIRTLLVLAAKIEIILKLRPQQKRKINVYVLISYFFPFF